MWGLFYSEKHQFSILSGTNGPLYQVIIIPLIGLHSANIGNQSTILCTHLIFEMHVLYFTQVLKLINNPFTVRTDFAKALFPCISINLLFPVDQII